MWSQQFESARGHHRTLHRVFTCRGRLTVWQRTANPSRGKTALTTKCQSIPRLRVRISLSAPYACVSEWLMELVQKTSGQKWPVGSNPTTCAMKSLHSLRLFVDFGDFFLFDATIAKLCCVRAYHQRVQRIPIGSHPERYWHRLSNLQELLRP